MPDALENHYRSDRPSAPCKDVPHIKAVMVLRDVVAIGSK